MRFRILCAIFVAVSVAAAAADEGMRPIAQLPFDAIARTYGVKLTQ